MAREVLADGSVRFIGRKVTRHVARLGPGRVLVSAWGVDDGENFAASFAELETEIRQTGKVMVFVDISRVASMSGAAREEAVKWSKVWRSHLEHTHILLRSKVVDMAIALVSMLTNSRDRIHTYSNARDFEAAIAREVPGFRGLDAALRAASPPPAA